MILIYLFFSLLLSYISSEKEKDWRKYVRSHETVFEGDMILPETVVKQAIETGKLIQDVGTPDKQDTTEPVAAGITAPLFQRWKGGEVPYYINPKLRCTSFTCWFKGAAKEIEEAMKEWSAKTCIKFRKKTDNDRDWIHFKDSKWGHCAAHIGRIGGEQFVYLGRFCRSKGIVLHEIGHALGFFHEQSRPDRDNHVTIYWDNIKKKHLHNFKKYTTGISDMKTPYDYDSIMHYGSKEFKKFFKFFKHTIKPKVRGKKIGQRKRLSYWDAEEMRRYYECPKKN